MIAEDPILGRVRLCSGCLEWWPDDEEFYYVPLGDYPAKRRCRACLIEKRAEWREVHRIERRARARELYAENLDRPVIRTRPRKDAA